MRLPDLTARQRALHLFVLAAFAIGQPLFAVLGDQPGFFVAHDMGLGDLVLLAAALALLVPLVPVALERLAERVSARAGQRVHSLLVAGLAALVALPLWGKLPALPGVVAVGLAALSGAGLAALERRSAGARTFLTFLAPAILIFPLHFLLLSPARSLVLSAPAASVPPVAVEKAVPLVLIVLDELPAPFLLDATYGIDPLRHPNFARLARRSHWFRNATTVADHTFYAVPAILTGRYPDEDRLPTPEFYPRTLFTWLRDDYRFHVRETLTDLCPDELCGEDPERPRGWKRLGSLLEDLAIVELHVLLPRDLTAGLPPVTQHWKDFRRSTAAEDQVAIFEEFLGSLDRSAEPTLYFLHLLLPHKPWRYLPSGESYARSRSLKVEGLRGDVWRDDEALVARGLERFLWQLAFVDRLLGRLLDRLEAVGLFDEALVVVTADHGAGFIPGSHHRLVQETNFHEILPVPLLIKLPHQRDGVVDDRNVETIDVAPTVLEVLGVDPAPLDLDGSPLLGGRFEERPQKVIFKTSRRIAQRYAFDPEALDARFSSTDRMLELLDRRGWIGDGEPPPLIFRDGFESGDRSAWNPG